MKNYDNKTSQLLIKQLENWIKEKMIEGWSAEYISASIECILNSLKEEFNLSK